MATELQREADSLDEEEAVAAMGSGLGTDTSASFEGAFMHAGLLVCLGWSVG